MILIVISAGLAIPNNIWIFSVTPHVNAVRILVPPRQDLLAGKKDMADII